jgi:hypothetical protein
MALATARLNALHQATSALASEAKAAQDEAAAATAACHDLIDVIVFGEAAGLAREAIASIQLHWQVIDRLRGLVLIDEARPGGPQLRGFQEDLLQSIDRRKAASPGIRFSLSNIIGADTSMSFPTLKRQLGWIMAADS